MKIEKQVLTIEQMNHLKELGLVVKDTAMEWYKSPLIGGWKIIMNEWDESELKDYDNVIPTLTLQEIKTFLPYKIEYEGDTYLLLEYHSDASDAFCADYISIENGVFKLMDGESSLEAAYNMLCWVLENGYLNKE